MRRRQPQRWPRGTITTQPGPVDILEFQPESRALLSHPFATRHSERSVPTPYSFPEIGSVDLRVGTRSRRISLWRCQHEDVNRATQPLDLNLAPPCPEGRRRGPSARQEANLTRVESGLGPSSFGVVAAIRCLEYTENKCQPKPGVFRANLLKTRRRDMKQVAIFRDYMLRSRR
jgi:hypothetical protein